MCDYVCIFFMCTMYFTVSSALGVEPAQNDTVDTINNAVKLVLGAVLADETFLRSTMIFSHNFLFLFKLILKTGKIAPHQFGSQHYFFFHHNFNWNVFCHSHSPNTVEMKYCFLMTRVTKLTKCWTSNINAFSNTYSGLFIEQFLLKKQSLGKLLTVCCE